MSMLPVRTSTSAPKGVLQRLRIVSFRFSDSTWRLADFSVARGAAASNSWRVVEEVLDTGEIDLIEGVGWAMSFPRRDPFNDMEDSLDASAVGVLTGDHGD